ncbi:hypothetical protein GCM10027614_57270 [Micromonospora vulcania]
MTLVLLVLALTGCDPETEGKVRYKPVLLPVSLTVGPDGVAIEGETSFITPIGEFSIGAEYSCRRATEARSTCYSAIGRRARPGLTRCSRFRLAATSSRSL